MATKRYQRAVTGLCLTMAVVLCSGTLNVWSMLVELSKEETSFVVVHRRVSFPSGGYVDVESSAWPMPRDAVVIYDHNTVEVELDRIDREIERLLKERDFVVDAGLRGFD